MKVGKLILALQQFDPDADICIATELTGDEKRDVCPTVVSVYSQHAKPVAERPGLLGSDTDDTVWLDIE